MNALTRDLVKLVETAEQSQKPEKSYPYQIENSVKTTPDAAGRLAE